MDSKTTGSFISARRKELGLTQAELADRLYVSDKAVSRWETGKGFPDINSLEPLASALGVSITELLRGEVIGSEMPAEEVNALAEEGLSLFRFVIGRKRIRQFCAGFLAGALLLAMIVVHLNSPVYIRGAENAVKTETLADGRIIALFDESVSGYDMEPVTDQDTGETTVFISAYRTRWGQIRGKKSELAAMPGSTERTDYIYYYPGESSDGSRTEDQLIYSKNGVMPSGGVVTLPRLIYNYWIIIGTALSIAGAVSYLVIRKKYYAKSILRAALLPVSFTVSAVICLLGNFDEVYNAAYYFSGILACTMIVYALLLMIVAKASPARRYRQQK